MKFVALAARAMPAAAADGLADEILGLDAVTDIGGFAARLARHD